MTGIEKVKRLTRTDLGGGIVRVSPECIRTEQKMGVGVTVYHFVDSIEEVSLS
jgi:hypothetical protein